MWLMKTLLTSGCTNQRGAGQPGTVIVGDNTVRGGKVLDADNEDPNVKGLRKFIQMISKDQRLEATAMQTVGEKGWDGFVIAIVKTL